MLGTYDAKSDAFLMDVNPANSYLIWMPTTTLIDGMRTFYTV